MFIYLLFLYNWMIDKHTYTQTHSKKQRDCSSTDRFTARVEPAEISFLPGCISRKLNWKRNNWDLNMHCNVRCNDPKWWLPLLWHSGHHFKGSLIFDIVLFVLSKTILANNTEKCEDNHRSYLVLTKWVCCQIFFIKTYHKTEGL